MMARAFEPFRFAVVTDVHINVKSKNPSEDLRQTVSAINNDDSIDFVLVTGDIADAGDGASLCLAHKLLSALHKPWYIIEGNHDQNWSESGCMDFIKITYRSNDENGDGACSAGGHRLRQGYSQQE